MPRLSAEEQEKLLNEAQVDYNDAKSGVSESLQIYLFAKSTAASSLLIAKLLSELLELLKEKQTK